MSRNLRYCLILPLLFILTLTLPIQAEVTVSPLSYTITGEEEIESLILTNNAETPALYSLAVSAQPWDAGNEEMAPGPRRDDRGGPDDMTYEWRDDQEDDGPFYEWIDILDMEGVVELEDMPDDTLIGMLELGFDFEYWGEVYNELCVSGNGYICLVPAFDIIYFWPGWEPLPNANGDPSPPPTMIAANYQDLNPIWHGQVFYWTNELDMAVITWHEVSHFVDNGGQGDYWTFQIILYGNGMIKFQYASVGVYDNSDAMIALQNEDRDMGFTMMFDEFDYIEPEKVIAIGPENSWITWLVFDPVSGEIEGGADAEINVGLDLEDIEDGVHHANLMVNIQGEDFQQRIDIPVLLSLNSPVGNLEGTITNADGDAPIEGALITLEPPGIIRYSDENGEFSIENLPARTYSLCCSYGEFFDTVLDEIEVVEDETADGSMELFHAQFNPEPDAVIYELSPDDNGETEFRVSNDGNAPVEFTSEFQLLGDVNAEPWETRETFDVIGPTEDNRTAAIAFDGNHFYVAGGAGGDPELNKIYVFDTEGNLQRDFDQYMESRYGIRDMAYGDGLLWGIDGDQVFGFTTDGNLETQFEGPLNPARCITYDSELDLLWLCSTSTELIAIDTRGNVVCEFDRPQGLRMTSLAYYPADPDGYCLYVFGSIDNVYGQVYKVNTEDGSSEFVAIIDTDGDRMGGTDITNELDVYSWVLLTILQDSDQIGIIQVEARKDWISYEPASGEIEAGAEQVFNVTFDSHGFPEATLEGEILFHHNGFGRELTVEVTLGIVLGRIPTERTIPIEMGWNMVSVNLQPDEEDVIELTQPLLDAELLVMMKDGFGHFYRPDFNYNDIPGWFVDQGYMIKVLQDCELTLEGMSVLWNDPIDMIEGWQIASYYPRVEVDARIALSGIVDNLLIAKNGNGNFYLPAWDFSDMGDLREGQGYMLKMTQETQLVYRLQMEEDEEIAASTNRSNPTSQPCRLPAYPVTGFNMSLLVLNDAALEGDLAVLASGQMVGSRNLQDVATGIAIWGDDPTTAATDGACPGDELKLLLYNDSGEHEVSYSTLDGEGVYETNTHWVVKLDGENLIPHQFGITSAYPNPFNSSTRVSYSLPEVTDVRLELYDLSGRLVDILVCGNQAAGTYTINIEGAELASGLYILQLEANQQVCRQKLTLIR